LDIYLMMLILAASLCNLVIARGGIVNIFEVMLG
jgi:hypothetical protein